VKQAESDQIVVAVDARELPVEYLVAADEGHGFRAPDSRMAVAAAMESFLARHIGGRYQEDMTASVVADNPVAYSQGEQVRLAESAGHCRKLSDTVGLSKDVSAHSFVHSALIVDPEKGVK
jgi:hypothetical protein